MMNSKFTDLSEDGSDSSPPRSWKYERRSTDYFQTPNRSNREFLEGDTNYAIIEGNEEKGKRLAPKRLFGDRNEFSNGVNVPKRRRLASKRRFGDKNEFGNGVDVPKRRRFSSGKKVVDKKRCLVKNRPSLSRFKNKNNHTIYNRRPKTTMPSLKKLTKELRQEIVLADLIPQHYLPMLDKKIRRLVKNRPSSRFKNKKYHTVVQLFIPQHDLTILDKKLRRLLRNIASLYGSKNWHSSKSYSSGGPICLAAFKKICIIQGKYLISLHHWETAVEYVQMAWSHVESIPNCDNHAVCKTKQACFKSLALHCKKALTMMISNGLTKKKSKDLLMWMEDAGKQSTAIQPCADVLKEFHSQSV